MERVVAEVMAVVVTEIALVAENLHVDDRIALVAENLHVDHKIALAAENLHVNDRKAVVLPASQDVALQQGVACCSTMAKRPAMVGWILPSHHQRQMDKRPAMVGWILPSHHQWLLEI